MAKVYQLPVSGVYMAENGSLQTSPLPGQTVMPGDDPNDVFLMPGVKINIGGVELQTYGGADSTPDLASVFGLSKDVKDTLSLASQAASVVVGVGTAVSFVISAFQLMGVLEKDDPFNILFDRIDKKLQTLLKATLAGSTLSTMQNVRNLVGHSETSGAIAVEHIKAGYPNDALAMQALGTADYWSRYAVTTLSGEEYWRRVYDEEAVRGDWMIGIKERAPVVAGLVWDYRFTLPAWLKAVIARIGVIEAMDPNHKNPKYHDEIIGYANFTRAVEGRIRSGIGRAVLPIGEENYPFMAKFHAQPSGAADIYSGLNDYLLWDAWGPSDEIDMMVRQQRGLPNNFQQYESQHAYLNELRFWRVYRWIGMFSFWQITPDLEKIANKFSPRPIAVPFVRGPYEQVSDTHSPFTKMVREKVIREAYR